MCAIMGFAFGAIVHRSGSCFVRLNRGRSWIVSIFWGIRASTVIAVINSPWFRFPASIKYWEWLGIYQTTPTAQSRAKIPLGIRITTTVIARVLVIETCSRPISIAWMWYSIWSIWSKLRWVVLLIALLQIESIVRIRCFAHSHSSSWNHVYNKTSNTWVWLWWTDLDITRPNLILLQYQMKTCLETITKTDWAPDVLV